MTILEFKNMDIKYPKFSDNEIHEFIIENSQIENLLSIYSEELNIDKSDMCDLLVTRLLNNDKQRIKITKIILIDYFITEFEILSGHDMDDKIYDYKHDVFNEIFREIFDDVL